MVFLLLVDLGIVIAIAIYVWLNQQYEKEQDRKVAELRKKVQIIEQWILNHK